ncbi:hypothetical protein EVAR_21630_1 [Eumeta japonica]|uniref:Uncharacterized protein n=1 Tax=Eumeta variegata TaxID=151549 RepID=A0A4C1UZ03_EUMVA|nr:hypothetical protein EVAR_21630_1 [Eumeta japonica]
MKIWKSVAHIIIRPACLRLRCRRGAGAFVVGRVGGHCSGSGESSASSAEATGVRAAARTFFKYDALSNSRHVCTQASL